jgi:hypothetical protein
MLEGAVILKETEVPVPEVGTLPVPDQPVQTYRVPVVEPDAGEDTEALIQVPESNQPLKGVGES